MGVKGTRNEVEIRAVSPGRWPRLRVDVVPSGVYVA